ncbi:MAG: transposase [Acidobacteriota bacterium]|nr:transposase [Acidobacteriota bacterium]
MAICCELYNAGIQERRDAWRIERKSISCYEQQAELPKIKEIRTDVAEVNAQVLTEVLKRVERTYKSFFNRVKHGEKAGFPRFKSGNRYDSFTYPQDNYAFSLRGNRLSLSKIGTVKIRLTRAAKGKIKTCTIKREISGWFVIFTVEDKPQPLPKTNKIVGIDAGIEHFLTLSDGKQIENPRHFVESQRKLRILRRNVSRKKKGSNRRKKATLKLRKTHQAIKNARSDFQHKVSRYLVNNFDLIAIEKLNVKALSRGFLSKQIHDAAWSDFFQKLRYKAEDAGREVIEVNPSGTSQTCLCGQRVNKTLSDRRHNCAACGLSEHRDIVSAKVILNLAVGQTVQNVTYASRQSVF